MERIRNVLQSAGIAISDRQLEQLNDYYQMVIETNQVMNLTAITEKEEFILLHYLDSLAPLYAAPELKPLFGIHGEETVSVRMIDVGTGAGFPGIPLKIICPALEVTLLDSLQKRVHFLDKVIGELSLSGITAIHSRAEDAARVPGLRDSFDLAVSRAVANLSALSEYALPFVRTGGTFLAYKSGEVREELASARNAIRLLGGEAEAPVSVTLPDSDVARTFVPIRKGKPTPKAYPRKAGTAKKQPL
ncbi:MAG: 16S rRNA (guanine(527)-N(7))-methyltransferase RsmG [Eubacterium sp.]|nr:16S rRNA (guanine(527)-N(7))-methyltransferase RsmG [Eubacterium sp.]